jgi:hypothetical protein
MLDTRCRMLFENWHFAFVTSLCLGALVAVIFCHNDTKSQSHEVLITDHLSV